MREKNCFPSFCSFPHWEKKEREGEKKNRRKIKDEERKQVSGNIKIIQIVRYIF